MHDQFTTWSSSPDAVPEGHVQVTVYDESTGERVATVFGSQANVDLVAAAPALYRAAKVLYGLTGRLEGLSPADESDVDTGRRHILEALRAAGFGLEVAS
jgi:hypothetical protein